MRATTFLSLFLFLIVSAQAQEKFKRSFIVTTEYDTVYGYILNKDFTKLNSMSRIKFADDNNEIHKYYPGEIIEFVKLGEGEYYSVSLGINDFFAKVIVTGEIKLLEYFYYNTSTNHFNQFTRTPMTSYFLHNTKTRISTFSHEIYREIPGFMLNPAFDKLDKKLSKEKKKFLIDYFYDYNALINDIRDKNYKYSDIPSIVKRYNEWYLEAKSD